MTTAQFALFFVALLVAYVLVHIRLVRFETYLREVSALKVVNERLKGVADSMTRVNLEPVEDRLDLIHTELRNLTESMARMEQAFARRSEPTVVMPTETTSAGDRVRALVETRLLSLGYRNLRLLTDLNDVSFGDELEITVECEKQQMPCKGKVVTANGEIRDVHIQSMSQAFP